MKLSFFSCQVSQAFFFLLAVYLTFSARAKIICSLFTTGNKSNILFFAEKSVLRLIKVWDVYIFGRVNLLRYVVHK